MEVVCTTSGSVPTGRGLALCPVLPSFCQTEPEDGKRIEDGRASCEMQPVPLPP